jgi:hypothetical protein
MASAKTPVHVAIRIAAKMSIIVRTDRQRPMRTHRGATPHLARFRSHLARTNLFLAYRIDESKKNLGSRLFVLFETNRPCKSHRGNWDRARRFPLSAAVSDRSIVRQKPEDGVRKRPVRPGAITRPISG